MDKKKLVKYLERDDARKVRKHLSEVKELLRTSLNSRGQNVLHVAAKSGSSDCLGVILSCGDKEGVAAATDKRDKKGRFPLHLAAEACLKDFSPGLMMDLVEPLVMRHVVEYLI